MLTHLFISYYICTPPTPPPACLLLYIAKHAHAIQRPYLSKCVHNSTDRQIVQRIVGSVSNTITITTSPPPSFATCRYVVPVRVRLFKFNFSMYCRLHIRALAYTHNRMSLAPARACRVFVCVVLRFCQFDAATAVDAAGLACPTNRSPAVRCRSHARIVGMYNSS